MIRPADGAALLCALALAGCAATPEMPSGAPGPGRLCASGLVTYRETLALTPEARLDLRVVDLSRGMAAVTVLAKVEGRIAGPVPRPFRICYDPAGFGMEAKPALRAWIEDRQATLFYKRAAVLLPPDQSVDNVYLVLDALGSTGGDGR